LEDIEDQYKQVLPFVFNSAKYDYLVEKLGEADRAKLMSFKSISMQEE
jgi:hypothetical protein